MNENDLNISNRVPQQPLQPEMPSMEIPVQPEMPSMEAPAQPEMPRMETPAQPEMPSMGAPAQPEMPSMEIPVQPEMPSMEAPAQPEMPSMEIPVQPEMPSMEAPAQPEMPRMETPAQPEMPSMGAPAQPEMPSMGAPAQPEMPSMEAPVQPEMPKMEDLAHQSESVPTVNFMDDFSEAVTTDPEPEIVTIQTPEMSFATDSTLGTNPLEESQKEEVAVQPEIVSVETPSENSVSTLDPILNPTSTVESVEQVDTSLEVGQITQEEVKSTKKKKSNWPFIILLFSIVGVCVLLFPVLVRIFGY